MSEKESFGRITQSSSQEIIFEVQKEILEDDYVLIVEETEKKTAKQILGVVSDLVHSRGVHKGKVNILGELDEKGKLVRCRIPPAITSRIIKPLPGLVSNALSYSGKDGICLGKIAENEPFYLHPNIVSRHALVAATTGAGKSYSVGVLLEEIIQKAPNKAIIIFDVSSEYWGLAYKNPEEVEELTSYNLESKGLWEKISILNPKELVLSDLFDLNRLKYLLELTSSQNTVLVNILKEKKPLFQLIEEIEEADPERIHPSTKQGLLSRLRSLVATGLYRSVSPTPLQNLLVPSEAVIVCLDHVDNDWIRGIIVKEICYELFKEKTTRGTEFESDILLVIEEAHRYSGKDGSKSILEAISREGRKYGIYEILISQRPSDVDSEIIANLNTLIALRIKNDADLAKIKKMEAVDSTIIQKLPRLERGEAIIVGESSIASHPILVKIRPRQTKHVDPRTDQMPPDIQVATELLELPLDETYQEICLDEDKSELFLNTHDEPLRHIFTSSTVEPPSTQTLADALKILHVIVMTKSTGLAIYDEGTGSIQVEVQLIAGCISALKSLLGEIGKAPKIKGRTRFRVLQEEGFLIWSCEGELSVAALLLKRPGSKELERRLRNFVYAFEKHFETEIKNFYGSTDPFIETRKLVDLHLGTGFMYPLRVHPETTNLSENERIVQNIILEVQQGMSPQEGQYVEEIIRRTTTNLDSSLNYRTILNAIIGLAQKNLIFSLTKQKLWIWEHPVIEKTEEERIIETKGKTEKEALSELEQELLSEFLTNIKVGEEIRIGEATTSEPSIGKQIATATKLESKEPSKISPTTSIEIPKILGIISDQSPQNIPEDIIEDILVRDIKYDPEYRSFSRTIKVERIPLSNVEKFLLRLSQTGHEQLELRLNPLKGPVIILQSPSGKKSVVSISRINGFCLVIVAT